MAGKPPHLHSGTDRKFFKGFFTKAGKKAVKAVLWVSADGLRVVDDKTKDLILDQTIEKVSFCAPDRNFERAFSYICRDGTTRRWICHCFMAVKDSGERLSHAVGCAFAACLERKQKREKECGVTATFDANRTTFTREGSFRVTTATEQAEREEVMRQIQEAKKAETEAKVAVPAGVVPVTANSNVVPPGSSSSPSSSPPLPPSSVGAQESNPHAIPRRHAPVEALARQGSFRGFPALSQKTSPFKRQLSLRMNELPSTVQRKSDFPIKNSVPEVEGEGDSISSLCTQITTAFSVPPEDPFSSAPMPKPASSPQSPAAPVNGSAPGFPPPANLSAAAPSALPPPLPARDTNPWAKTPTGPSAHGPTHPGDWTSPAPAVAAPPAAITTAPTAPTAPVPPPSHRRTPSEADRWLEEVSKSVRAQQPTPTMGAPTAPAPAFPSPLSAPVPAPAPAPAPVAFMPTLPPAVPLLPPRQPAYQASAPASYPMSNGIPYAQPSVPVVGITPSQMVANVFGSATGAPPPPVPPQPFPNPQVSFPPVQYDARAACSPFNKPPQPPPNPAPITTPFMQPPNGNATFNGADSWVPPSLPPPSSPAPPLPPQSQPQTQAQADAFEAQWAALESRSRQRTTPSPTNPFSSELHKTFEIQL
ncbi:hypothetical protein JZ751_003140 [Albula glossodonta]|uniref:PID domain-containing protein n=1 Tax=Albula glossodonta TaxID=121402 RepID=A0A8T2NGH5_9TELE|nr:hypothetical protein JZ751_003140 [Albula glossodonta]